MNETRSVGGIGRFLGTLWLRLFGWTVEGRLPDAPKVVVIAAPHTSNWDLPHMLAVAYVLGVRPAWLGKKELFVGPAGVLFRLLGGVSIDRSKRANVVQQVADRFAEVDRLFLVIPPSGTRSRAPHWKSGFYHIARAANVPIVASFLDYRRKVGGIGPVLSATGDVVADMDKLRTFYANVTGRYPNLTTPVKLAEEDTPLPAVS